MAVADPAAAITHRDRIAADAVRALARRDGFDAVYRDAATLDLDAIATPEARVVCASLATAAAPDVEQAASRIRGGIRLLLGLALVLAVVFGAAAANAALTPSREEYINVFWALLGLLGVQTVALAAWLLVALWPFGTVHLGVGAAMIALARRGAQRLYGAGSAAAAAGEALGRAETAGAGARWSLGVVTHAFWLAFNLGAIGGLLLLLSTRQYSFAWETTILSTDAYTTLTRTLSAAPSAVGAPAPELDQIVAARWPDVKDHPEAAAQQAWAGLLVGSLIAYGAAPRVALLLLTLLIQRLARARYRLDVDDAISIRLLNALRRDAADPGVVDPAPEQAPTPPAGRARPASHARGSVALVGVECDVDAQWWPPGLPGVDWRDLGGALDRHDRRRILAALSEPDAAASRLVLVADLNTTPDRGLGAFIASLLGVVRCPTALILTGGQALRESLGATADVDQRIADWRTLAVYAGLSSEAIIETDLAHLTDASRAALRERLGFSAAELKDDDAPQLALTPAPPKSQLSAAFRLIVDAAERWDDAPSLLSQAELHRNIARAYEADRDTSIMTRFQRIASDVSGPGLGAKLRDGIDDVQRLLPPRLKSNTRWMAAGGLAGALGCIAAATLASPLAISALPVWAGTGAAIAAAMGWSRTGDTERDDATGTARRNGPETTEAVRAAALYAVLLDLQGVAESSITRVLDRTFGEAPELTSGRPDATKAWLDEVLHQYELARTAVESRA